MATPVVPVKTPEQIKHEELVQAFIAAGNPPENAETLATQNPNAVPVAQGHYGTILNQDQQTQKWPVQITDKEVVDSINAAKTPEEKQAIIDKWNMEHTQEAANNNAVFKKEADTNSDGVIDAKEAGIFQDNHAAATYNASAHEK